MKTRIGFLLPIAACCFLPMMQSIAQENVVLPPRLSKQSITPSLPVQPLLSRTTGYTIPGKRASQYTADDWGKVIDSTWGAGQSASAQLNVFDAFWNYVDQLWAGFPNLAINWDSLRTLYRSQIGSGLSRGRFYALMSRMWLALLEHHTYVYDLNVEMSFLNGTVLKYRSGVPLLCFNTGWAELLGAAVTPMPDSSGLVYRITPGNPLGLESGDLVLGYEGIPWKRLYRQMLDSGVPVSNFWSSPGSTPESRNHEVLSAVGWNWGMFDTIDVVKYSTGDTLHLPTAPLATFTPNLWATDQVPIDGVPMPQANINTGITTPVSWGVVQGTNIGYVYAWDWGTTTTGELFKNAIYDLCHNKKVSGLVVDFRTNWGGIATYANDGLAQLFNFDPTPNMSFALRNSTSDHFDFTLSSASSLGFHPAMSPFDRPIAVLIGPACLSSGDLNAFRMRFHPMARSFGKPTNGAFVYGVYATGTLPDAWSYQIPRNIDYSNVPGEGYLIHKGVQPDEQVWLTRDGVAKGKDDVVERALAWMANLAYAHDVHVDPLTPRKQLDTVRIRATVQNPQTHALVVRATTVDLASGKTQDSISLFNDGLHGDGLAADSLWGGFFVPSTEGVYGVSVRTDDPVASTSRTLPNVGMFASAGPLKYAGIHIEPMYDTVLAPGATVIVTIGLRNTGTTGVIPGVTAVITAIDSGDDVGHSNFFWGSINPGTVVYSSDIIGLYFWSGRHGGSTASFALDMYSQGALFWRDTMRIVMTGAEATNDRFPASYALEQNYPNPFNPATTIRYSLPHKSQVFLAVYNTLGQWAATLVQAQQEAGVYELKFDGSRLASGVYFYRIQAGSFVETKKLVLIR